MNSTRSVSPAPHQIERLGRYQILSELGQGAMGTVYEARDPTLDRLVAIKTVRLLGDARGVADFRARFHAEAKSAGRLSHPNIVTIYDFGELGDIAYIAMELLKGETLRVLLDRQRFGVRRAVRYAMQLAEGLGAAHALGVIHRDIKPGNVVRLESGILKITDFGIAQMPASNLTMEGTLLGTPRYMSPEQIKSIKGDPRSDIFSLGVLLYEMLTGVVPFDGPSVSAIMYQIVHDRPIDPRRLNANVPEALAAILSRCLVKDPNKRFQTMAEVSRALRTVGQEDAQAIDMLETFLPLNPGDTEPQPEAPSPAKRFIQHVEQLAHAHNHANDKTLPLPGAEAQPVARALPSVARIRPAKPYLVAGASVFGVAVVAFAVRVFLANPGADPSAAVPAAVVAPAAASVAPASVSAQPVTATLTTATPLPEAQASVDAAKPVAESGEGAPPLASSLAVPAPALAPRHAKKKAVVEAPVIVNASEVPPPAVVAAPVAAPPPAAAPSAVPKKDDSLAQELKRQRDCLVTNHCDNQ